MRTAIDANADPTPHSDASRSTATRLRASRHRAAEWLAERLEPGRFHSLTQLAAILASIFLLALCVRLLHWQDSYAEMAQGGSWNSAIARHYQSEARRMLDEGGILFPNSPVDPGDARPILHPPGYSALIAAIFWLSGDGASRIRITQIVFDALSAVMVFLIAAEFFPRPAAAIAAALAALSPHLSYYSLWISPDTLCVFPILAAVYLIAKASKRPRLIPIVGAGVMVGLSCWLRANALMLAPLLAVAVVILFAKSRRLGYAAALVAATVIVVSPITIRNWILYHHFIPISITGGENLLVGIADVDKEGRFGMPTSDGDAATKDAEWYNRPDYAISAWLPDGVERDQWRYARGLEVIRANPGWFLGAMLKRAGFMLRYNDSSGGDWPFTTSRVPIVSADPPVFHSSVDIAAMQRAWTSSAKQLSAEGSVLSPDARASLASDEQTLEIEGDASNFGDQFASGAIAVAAHTDYLLMLRATAEQGASAAKITDSNRRIVLASAALGGERAERRLKRDKKKAGADANAADREPAASIEMPFASGDRTEVRFVLSNNLSNIGHTTARPVTQINEADLFELGRTRYLWTRYPRALVRGIQKNVFKTGAMLPAVLAGIVLLGLAGRGRALVILLAVPAYYLVAQSALSTEYRYILAIHYFLFIAAAVTVYVAGVSIRDVIRAIQSRRTSPANTPDAGPEKTRAEEI